MKNPSVHENKITEVQFECLLTDFEKYLLQAIELCDENRWLKGLLNVLDSKHYIGTILEDINICLSTIGKGAKVLDFGCGCGVVGYIFARLGYEVSCVDIDDFESDKPTHIEMGQQQSKLWRLIESELKNIVFYHYSGDLPFNSDKFDLVIAYAVIEHIPNDSIDGALIEVRRVAKKDSGLFVSRLPRRLSYIEAVAKLFGIPAHEKLYGKLEIARLLERYEINIVYYGITDFLPSYPSKYVNKFPRLIKHLESACLKTPLRYLAHHQRLYAIFKK